MEKTAWLLVPLLLGGACSSPPPPIPWGASRPVPPSRRVIRLDGTWQIQQGSLDTVPSSFPSSVPVPGLADMACPAFPEVGRKSSLREAFWYRRVFTLEGPPTDFALLKIHKARYGTKVWINGRPAGEHLPCFTPALLEVRDLLRFNGQKNEIVIRVGAHRESIPSDRPSGWDFEKYLYLPGIYDSVDLILTGAPRIRNVQIVPEVEKNSVRFVAEIEAAGPVPAFPLAARVAPADSPETPAAEQAFPQPPLKEGGILRCDHSLPLPGARLWSPEDPFLYVLRLSTGGDALETRFGMRSFRFDPASGRALLNGKPYFLRGTNICFYRFFEDAERGDRPWRAEWARRLLRKFKTMDWNAMRWCIGFPPEFWYDLADEEGWIIQDEFPVWILGKGKAPENPSAASLIEEYTEWMRERWNHPCVAIWDAQNESLTDETGKAIRAVRALDLSRRPWENGWSEPQDPADCVEAHPYLMIGLFNKDWAGGRKFSGMKDMKGISGTPGLNERQRKLRVPILVNEYAWLWLNRDGTTTCLTGPVYEKLLGPGSTADQRRRLYAQCLAAKTEFWRAHRACAGVLHFCGLGYSRAGDKPRPEGGATSDHFIDLERLVFEPYFEEYVPEAFAPLGLMADFWEEEVPCRARRAFKVYVINDLDREWEGPVRVSLRRQRDAHPRPEGGSRPGWRGQEKGAVSESERPCRVPPFGREILSFEIDVPSEPGTYLLQADLTDPRGRVIRSRREFRATR